MFLESDWLCWRSKSFLACCSVNTSITAFSISSSSTTRIPEVKWSPLLNSLVIEWWRTIVFKFKERLNLGMFSVSRWLYWRSKSVWHFAAWSLLLLHTVTLFILCHHHLPTFTWECWESKWTLGHLYLNVQD